MSKVPDTEEIAKKRADEAVLVSQMIALYCRGNHEDAPRAQGETTVRLGHCDVELCEECAELRHYATVRIEHCPRMDTKTFCSVCPTHCYRPDMRERIRTVMRWSGPRMLRYRPIKAMQHALVTVQHKQAEKKAAKEQGS